MSALNGCSTSIILYTSSQRLEKYTTPPGSWMVILRQSSLLHAVVAQIFLGRHRHQRNNRFPF